MFILLLESFNHTLNASLVKERKTPHDNKMRVLSALHERPVSAAYLQCLPALSCMESGLNLHRSYRPSYFVKMRLSVFEMNGASLLNVISFMFKSLIKGLSGTCARQSFTYMSHWCNSMNDVDIHNRLLLLLKIHRNIPVPSSKIDKINNQCQFHKQ